MQMTGGYAVIAIGILIVGSIVALIAGAFIVDYTVLYYIIAIIGGFIAGLMAYGMFSVAGEGGGAGGTY